MKTETDARFRVRAGLINGVNGEIRWLVYKPLNEKAKALIHNKQLSIRPLDWGHSDEALKRAVSMQCTDWL